MKATVKVLPFKPQDIFNAFTINVMLQTITGRVSIIMMTKEVE